MTASISDRTPDRMKLREAFSHFPQGVVLIGAEVDGSPQGLIASTFTVGVSLDPPLVAFAAQHASETWSRLRQVPSLGVSLMGIEQSDIIWQLASKQRDRRFAGVDFSVDKTGALTLRATPAWMTTRIYDEFKAGDHDIILLEVLSIGNVPGTTAIVFHRSVLKALEGQDRST